MTPNQIAELKRIAKKAEPLLANCEGHLNHPLRNRDGKRVVGFVLPEDIAGLSDGLFMVEAVQQLAEAVLRLSSGRSPPWSPPQSLGAAAPRPAQSHPGREAGGRMKVRSTGQPVGEVARGESPEDTTEPKTSTILPDLIARLEQAGEGSRELDTEVWFEIGWNGQGDERPVPPLTTSVDAALALIGKQLPGWTYTLTYWPPDAEAGFTRVTLGGPGYISDETMSDTFEVTKDGDVPALALCLALCHALQSQGETHDA